MKLAALALLLALAGCAAYERLVTPSDCPRASVEVPCVPWPYSLFQH